MAGYHYCRNHRIDSCAFAQYYENNSRLKILRVVVSIIAVFITGRVSLKTNGTTVGNEWFSTIAMFILSYVPEILVKEESKLLKEIRLTQIILTSILGLISLLGIFNILTINSIGNKNPFDNRYGLYIAK